MKMKIALYYFSGTGNTKCLVDRLAHILRPHGIELSVFPLEKGFHELEGGCEHIIFAFPANSQAVSPFIWQFFRSLPKAKGTEVDILITLNESTYVLKPLEALLKRKGYVPMSVTEISMPNNMLTEPANDAADKVRIETAFQDLELFAKSIVIDRPYRHPAKKGSFFVSFLARNTGLPSMSMRRIFVLQIRNDLCTRCGLCVRECPVGNIEMGDVPKRLNRCELCMKCLADCPEKAIFFKGKENMIVRKVPLWE